LQIFGNTQGDTIETFFGAALCLSTMAGNCRQNKYLVDWFWIAAGLGNAVSDVMGIGFVNDDRNDLHSHETRFSCI